MLVSHLCEIFDQKFYHRLPDGVNRSGHVRRGFYLPEMYDVSDFQIGGDCNTALEELSYKSQPKESHLVNQAEKMVITYNWRRKTSWPSHDFYFRFYTWSKTKCIFSG